MTSIATTFRPVPSLAARALQVAAGVAILAIYMPAVWELPRFGPAMAVTQVGYGVLLVLLPRVWLIVLPFITVALDLAPWTGRFLFSEYDGFFAVTIAVAALMGSYQDYRPHLNLVFGLLLAYLALYLINISELSAFFSPPGRQVDNPYYSPLYSYKVGKGLVWGGVLAWLWMSQYRADRESTLRWSIAGVLLAAWTLLLLGLWERGTLLTIADAENWWQIANSILNFSGEYRITGIFADMHTGGEVIDGLMILLLPLLLIPLLRVQEFSRSLLLLSAIVAVCYCIVIGVTRATWATAGLAIAASVAAQVWMGIRNSAGEKLETSTLLGVTAQSITTVVLAQYLYQQAGSMGLLVNGVLIATAVLVGTIDHCSPRRQLIALLSIDSLLAFEAVSAHYAHQYVSVTPVSRLLVPGCVFLGSLAIWWVGRRAGAGSWREKDWRPALRRILLLVVFPSGFAIALGSFSFNDRMQSTAEDYGARSDHWWRVIASADTSPLPLWFGNGIGSFPRRYIEAYPETLAEIGSYTLPAGEPRLRLGVGRDLAIVQRLVVEPWSEYTVNVRTRSMGTGFLLMRFCPQNQLVFNFWSRRCVGGKFRYGTVDAEVDRDGFEAHSATFNTGELGSEPLYLDWPVSFQIEHQSGDSPVEISGLAVTGPVGQSLNNTDFAEGLDQWFFHANFAHLPWHIKNMWLEVWFETGIVGLILLLALLLVTAFRAIKIGYHMPEFVAISLSLWCLFALGAFGSPLDSSRVSTWFYMLLIVGVICPSKVEA